MQDPPLSARNAGRVDLSNSHRVLTGVSAIKLDSISIRQMCATISHLGTIPILLFGLIIKIQVESFSHTEDIASAPFTIESTNAVLCGGASELLVPGTAILFLDKSII